MRDDSALDAAVHDFVQHRQKLRKPMTDKAVDLFVDKLERLAPGDTPKKIQLINTAIESGWQNVYPPDTGHVVSGPPGSGSRRTKSEEASDYLERLIRGEAE